MANPEMGELLVGAYFVERRPQTPVQLREAVVATFEGVDGRF